MTDSRDPDWAEDVWLVETNLDDLSGEILGTLIPSCLEAGAVDAWITPILGKKGRPAHVLSALVPDGRLPAVETALFRESSTLGIRRTRWQRTVLDRSWTTVPTPWGPVRVKVGKRAGEVLQRSPEFEDCREVARKAGIPVTRVYDAARAATIDHG